MTTRPCISADDLAAFIDAALPPADRDRVIEHLADCPRCQAIYADVVELMGEPKEEEEEKEELPTSASAPIPFPERPSARPRAWMQLAAGIAALGVGVALWWFTTARNSGFDEGTILTRLTEPATSDAAGSALRELGVGETLRGDEGILGVAPRSVDLGAKLAQVKLQERLGTAPAENAAALQEEIGKLDTRARPFVELGQWLTYSYVACSTGNLDVLNDTGFLRWSREAADLVGTRRLEAPDDFKALRRFTRPWTTTPTEDQCSVLALVYDAYTRSGEEF